MWLPYLNGKNKTITRGTLSIQQQLYKIKKDDNSLCLFCTSINTIKKHQKLLKVLDLLFEGNSKIVIKEIGGK